MERNKHTSVNYFPNLLTTKISEHKAKESNRINTYIFKTRLT